MARRVLLPPVCALLILALAMIQCSSLHALSELEDDDYIPTDEQDVTNYAAEFSDRTVMPSDDDGYANIPDVRADEGDVFSDADWEISSDQSAGETSFAEESDGGNAGWESFTMREMGGNSSEEYDVGTTFASTDSMVSAEDVTSPLSLAVDEEEEQEADVESDDHEVYFDTSGANRTMIYKAAEGGGDDDQEDDGGDGDIGVNGVSTADVTTVAGAMGGCGTGNPIDDCWRCDASWRKRRKTLAKCIMGFGRGTRGGRDGPIYVVTSSSDDVVNPKPGTLRHGLTRKGPLWIIFRSSMIIRPKAELWVSSFKTIDGRGADVHIVGVQTTIQNASHVIVHGVSFHDIKITGPTMMRISPSFVGPRPISDGDALHILNSKYIWIDHCFLAKATDGLLDATRGSNFITISNNVFENHNKVMLLGSSPTFPQDRRMRVTISYNRFGPGLIQRIPRCRFGVFHVVNNYYANGWQKYAIGGSEDPTILSQGNVFNARATKDVTKHIDDEGPTFGGWEKWNWASSGDVFQNGAYFTGSGSVASQVQVYAKAISAAPRPASLVPAMTQSAGPILSGL